MYFWASSYTEFSALAAASIASFAGSFCEHAATASTAASAAMQLRMFTGRTSGRLDFELVHDGGDLRLRVAGGRDRSLERGAGHVGRRLAPGVAGGVVVGDRLLPFVAGHALRGLAALRRDLLVHRGDHAGHRGHELVPLGVELRHVLGVRDT